MIIRKPSFYDEFRCIASKCPDSCCQDWAVTIDEDSRRLYESIPGALGDALRENLTEEDGEIVLKTLPNGRCPMWREDGLCRIQAEMGETALSCVCRQFPRLTHDYGDFRELGLELSCPEAARLIVNAHWAWQEEETAEEGIGEYDGDAMAVLKSARGRILSILRDTRYSVPEALAICLLYGYEMQAVLDGEEELPFREDAALESARSAAVSGDYPGMLQFFSELEILRNSWKIRLKTAEAPEKWENFRNIAIYFADRYILQAISDYDLVSRVKLMVISCILLHYLGGDLQKTAQEYSKEIENDIDNLDAVLDGAYTEAAFADSRLLGCLMENTGE